MCAKDFILNKMGEKEECACSSCFETTKYTCLRCERLKKKKESTLEVHTHLKPTETFQYRIYQRRSVKTSQNKNQTFEENITLFKQRLPSRGYLDNLINKTRSEVNLRERMSALQNKLKTRKNILRFVLEYRPSVPNLKQFR